MGSNNDYFFSIYGAKAKAHFDQLPKLTASCAYAETEVDAKGNETDTLKMTIGGEKINSLLCRHIGEDTYACEASTLWVDGACKND
jgi:hypothetical protein